MLTNSNQCGEILNQQKLTDAVGIIFHIKS